MKKRVLIILLFILLAVPFFYGEYRPPAKIEWGLNFSARHASYLGADWKREYLEILDDLKPKRLRLFTFWNEIEPRQGQYDFAATDFLLGEAAKRGAKVILVVGQKQPRWPECHIPSWAREITNSKSQIPKKELLQYIEKTVARYRDNPAVVAWQVENEPFFEFGPGCPAMPRDLFREELALVKKLDDRPIVVTDSGEKGLWLPTARAGGDIFGSTMYREVYHDKRKKYVHYLIPPALYRLKAGVVKSFSPVRRFVVVELQAEPWFATDVYHTPWPRQQELMNTKIFAENVAYARRAGFAENYLWGVEWWYWAKQTQGDDLWQAAKKLLAE